MRGAAEVCRVWESLLDQACLVCECFRIVWFSDSHVCGARLTLPVGHFKVVSSKVQEHHGSLVESIVWVMGQSHFMMAQ
jgi:hypothetical protein